ncbi:MAG: EAL domain-containing protein, partial [Nitrososphaera sp.]|nr:EAL domain-containing protein [Nitrososphaera sp.]
GLCISVNLSSTQFLRMNLLQEIDQALLETGLEARSLRLEITETVMMENPESATATLLQLKARNIRTSLDDFGTGYSSLSYLQRFPIDALKIDQSFIGKMVLNGESFEIVKTIIALAHNLGRKVVAEGVETAEQLAVLRSLKCEEGQGYLFSKPLDSKAAEKLLAAGHRW